MPSGTVNPSAGLDVYYASKKGGQALQPDRTEESGWKA
jgi:hypothetical protein